MVVARVTMIDLPTGHIARYLCTVYMIPYNIILYGLYACFSCSFCMLFFWHFPKSRLRVTIANYLLNRKLHLNSKWANALLPPTPLSYHNLWHKSLNKKMISWPKAATVSQPLAQDTECLYRYTANCTHLHTTLLGPCEICQN